MLDELLEARYTANIEQLKKKWNIKTAVWK